MTLDPSLKVRILVVDDEYTTRSAVARALSLLGYKAHAAGSGSEALSELAACEYDLMLLDLRMPGMDGMEVLAQARQSYPDLLVIVLTAYATPAGAVEAMRAGAADYLLKPCSLEEIEAAISGALERRLTTSWPC
jgi:DNA-binding NtrC family response regulator